MIFDCEYEFYERIADELRVVFDVGCRGDNPFEKYGCEVHQFDAAFQPKARGIFNHTAVGHKIGNVNFHPEYGSILKRMPKGEKWANLTHYTVNVPMITIDHYCEKHGIKSIDLLKIDVEGYDVHVIEGAMSMLPNIKYIQFEHWDSERTARIMELLKDYEIKPLGGKPLNFYAVRRDI